MKVIATTPNGFLLEASDDEIARLMGYYSGYAFRDKFRKRYTVEVGDEIAVAKMYESLSVMSTNSSKMEQVRGILTAVAKSLEVVDPILRQVDVKCGPDKE